MKKTPRISKTVIKDYDQLVMEISKLNGIIYHSQSIIEAYLVANSRRKGQDNYDLFLASRLY